MMKRKKLVLTAVLIGIIVISVSAGIALHPMDVGYMQGTQGLDFQFHSVRRNGEWWSATERGSPTYGDVYPSVRSFGAGMVLDPDHAEKGMPDLCGNVGGFQLVDPENPVPYIWQVKTGTTVQNGQTMDVYKQYAMYRYQANFSLNLQLSGTEWEADGKYDDAWLGSYVSPNWGGSEIWIKVKPQSFAYFSGNPEKVYFAPAYMGLTKDAMYGGVTEDPSAYVTTIPNAQGDVLGFFYQRGGGDVKLDESKLLSYQGEVLDPAIFREEYWIRVNLVQFKPRSWIDWFWHKWEYPTVHLEFKIYVYAIGQWTTYFKQGELPDHNPPQPTVKTSDPISNFFAWLGGILAGIGQFFGNLFGAAATVWTWIILLAIALLAVGLIFMWLMTRGGHSSSGTKTGASSRPTTISTGGSSGSGLGKLSILDWGIIGILVLLAFIPFDPTDIIDMGLPILEPLLALGYGYWRTKS
jgi:hypothetical protein